MSGSQKPHASSQVARRAVMTAQSVAVLTGAGISAESGVPTFRGEAGLWRTYRPEDLATPAAYARDPELVWDWYATRFASVTKAQPNGAHRLLAALEGITNLTLVTQNVDGLHRRAGSKNVLELHGNLTQSRCECCGRLDPLELGFRPPPRCSSCSSRARPNVVWFGEQLPQGLFERAVQAFASAEVALVIGTSGVVEPAASLARLAKGEGAFLVVINPERTPLSSFADLHLSVGATRGLETLLGEGLPTRD